MPHVVSGSSTNSAQYSYVSVNVIGHTSIFLLFIWLTNKNHFIYNAFVSPSQHRYPFIKRHIVNFISDISSREQQLIGEGTMILKAAAVNMVNDSMWNNVWLQIKEKFGWL